MNEKYNDSITNCIKNGLKPLYSDPSLIDKVASDIREVIRFIDWKPPPESGFYDFSGKIDRIVQHFSNIELKRDDFIKMATRLPTIFILNPETAIANIEAVATHFSTDGLTRRDYLHAALGQPFLFSMKPSTVIGNIKRVVEHFADDGLTTADYLHAILQQPSLFADKSERIIARIEGVTSHFAPEGMSRKKYLETALKRPTLFSQSSNTIIEHINILDYLNKKGLIIPSKRSIENNHNQSVFNLVYSIPQILSYSNDNLLLREIAATHEGYSLSPTMLKKSRKLVEKELHIALEHYDEKTPVQKVGVEAGIGKHARNLLLRALIREGIAGGRLV